MALVVASVATAGCAALAGSAAGASCVMLEMEAKRAARMKASMMRLAAEAEAAVQAETTA